VYVVSEAEVVDLAEKRAASKVSVEDLEAASA
jgi:hypothetical protein